MRTCLALLLVLLPCAISHAAENASPADHHDQPAPSSPAKILADQVAGIAHSPTLTLKEKDADILTDVHNAVVAATAHLTDPVDILKVTLELTTAAAAAAPQFSTEIIEAVSTIQAITTISGALHEIQSSVVDAAAKAAAASFDSDHSRDDRDHDGDYDHDHHHDHDFVVSPSH